MQSSSMNLFLISVSLLCLVHPLSCNSQPPYWINHETYNPVVGQLQPPRPVQVFSERYRPSVTRGLPTYVTQYEQKSSTFDSSNSPSRTDLSSYPDGVPETKYLRQKEDQYFQHSIQIPDESKEAILENKNTSDDANEQEITKKLQELDRLLSEDSSEIGLDTNAIEDKIIPDESRRVVREVRKQRPGFFWTLARVTFETINDTRSAIKQISDIINNNIAPDSPTQDSMTSALTAIGSTVNATVNATLNANLNETLNGTETTTMSPTTTARQNFTLTRSRLQSIIRRNVLGLVRLFNIEWRDALNQSEVTVKEFQRDLGDQVGMYLRDNPDAY